LPRSTSALAALREATHQTEDAEDEEVTFEEAKEKRKAPPSPWPR
jgi:hypothetical protein